VKGPEPGAAQGALDVAPGLVEETPGDLGAGMEVVCPGNAVYFLTSVEP